MVFTKTSKHTKIAPHNTNVFKWFNFLHGLQFFSPIALIYFASITKSYASAASILSAAYMAQVIFEIPTGLLSDVVGRRKTAALGAACYALALVFYSVGGSYWVLFLGALCAGLSGAFFSGNNDSLLYESGQQDGDGKYHIDMGKVETYFHFAATISAIAGGLLAIASFRAAFLASLVPALGMVLLSFAIIEPKHIESIKMKSLYHVADAAKYLARNTRLRMAALASSLEFGVGHALFGLQQAFVNTLWPIWAVGINRALSGLFATVSFMLSGRIVEKFGPLKTVLASQLWGKLTMFVGLVQPTITSPAILSTSSLAFGPSTIAQSSVLQKEFTAHQRATLGSITSLAGSFWFAVASVVLGYLADRIGLQKAMLAGLLPGLVVLVVYMQLRGHELKDQKNITNKK